MKTKIVNPGTIDGYNTFCEINYDEDKKNLSITGVIGPMRNGNSNGGCGQINPIEPDSLTEDWNYDMIETFNLIWENYHLNDLQAGCEHQQALNWTYESHKGKACPICGYKIGSQWMRKEVPEWVINWLFNLPDSQIKPAWV